MHLDTSVLIGTLTGPKDRIEPLYRALESGVRLVVSSIVLYEWLRGPRGLDEIAVQESLFPADSAVPFEPEDAALSADLYRSVRRARCREIDIAIAACAIRRQAQLWTLNPRDFSDIPGLSLWRPAS